MPYQSNQDLPPSLRRALSGHAQDIFRAAFNNAWQQYGGDEAMAHRIAWSAVKRKYQKIGGAWLPKVQ
jgi:cation transport regulator